MRGIKLGILTYSGNHQKSIPGKLKREANLKPETFET